MEKEFLAELYSRENELRDAIYQRVNINLVVVGACISMNGYIIQRVFIDDFSKNIIFSIIYFLGVVLMIYSIHLIRKAIGKYEHAHAPTFKELKKRRQELIRYNSELFWYNATYGEYIERRDVDVMLDEEHCELLGQALDINRESNKERVSVYHDAMNFSAFSVILTVVSFAFFSLGGINRDSPITPKLVADKELVNVLSETNNILRSFYERSK